MASAILLGVEFQYEVDGCRHNCIKLSKRRWFRKTIIWRCIDCDRDFGEYQHSLFDLAAKERITGIEFEQEVALGEAVRDYVIQEEP